MRLIDADELKNREIVIDYDEVEDTFDDGLLFVTDLIDKSPTVDAVPVVRCRECRHNYANMIPGGEGCAKCIELPITPDFYCKNGEREDGRRC